MTSTPTDVEYEASFRLDGFGGYLDSAGQATAELLSDARMAAEKLAVGGAVVGHALRYADKVELTRPKVLDATIGWVVNEVEMFRHVVSPEGK